jgi:hypothetical protein
MSRPIAPEPHALTVRRACLPEILFVPDVALALQIGRPTARRMILAGECGPFMRVGRRLAVRRESLLRALAEREIHPAAGAVGTGVGST